MGEGEGEGEGEKEEEKMRRIQVWNSCLEVWNTCLDICKETIVRMLVSNCLETLVLEILVQVGLGKP